MAFCLLGLLNVNMPLLYGEGLQRAFIRLQLEIVAQSSDESIFAWDFADASPGALSSSCFASHPKYFINGTKIEALRYDQPDHIARPPYTVTNRGLSIHCSAIRLHSPSLQGANIVGRAKRMLTAKTCYLLPLNCLEPYPTNGSEKRLRMIGLREGSNGEARRISGKVTASGFESGNIHWRKGTLRPNNSFFTLIEPAPDSNYFHVSRSDQTKLRAIHCFQDWLY